MEEEQVAWHFVCLLTREQAKDALSLSTEQLNVMKENIYKYVCQAIEEYKGEE